MMEAEEQRKVVADAAARGLTIEQFMGELMSSPDLFLATQVPSGPPQTGCPVIQVILDYVVPIGMTCFPGTKPDAFFENFSGVEDQLRQESSEDEQARRARITMDWFAKDLLPIIESDIYQPSTFKILEACKEVLLAVHSSPRAQATAVMQATLILVTSINEQYLLEKQGKKSMSNTHLRLANGISYELVRRRMLGSADGIAFTSSNTHVRPPPFEMDADLIEQLNEAERLAGIERSEEPGVFIAAGDDIEPDGIFKKP